MELESAGEIFNVKKLKDKFQNKNRNYMYRSENEIEYFKKLEPGTLEKNAEALARLTGISKKDAATQIAQNASAGTNRLATTVPVFGIGDLVCGLILTDDNCARVNDVVTPDNPAPSLGAEFSSLKKGSSVVNTISSVVDSRA